MTATLTPELQRRIDAVPVKYRPLYRRSLTGRVSPRTAIKLKCLECCAWLRIEDGQDKIGGCAVVACPLWRVRPFQKAAEHSQVAVSATSSPDLSPDSPEAQP